MQEDLKEKIMKLVQMAKENGGQSNSQMHRMNAGHISDIAQAAHKSAQQIRGDNTGAAIQQVIGEVEAELERRLQGFSETLKKK